MLQQWIASGRIIDIMLAVLVVEVFVLIAYRTKTGRGPSITSVLLNIGAGGSLIVALKLALADASWQIFAAALVAAFFFHSADLAWRWRNSA